MSSTIPQKNQVNILTHIDSDGDKYYYISLNDDDKSYLSGHLFHREDGPAIEWASGAKGWLQYGRYHRLDGPAYDSEDVKTWWYMGEHIPCTSQEEFEIILKLRAFW